MNPWALPAAGGGPVDIQKLLQLGKFGLESGLVSPEQAQAEATQFAMAPAPGPKLSAQNQMLFDVGSVPNPGGASPNKVGSKIGFTRDMTQNKKSTKNLLLSRDPEEYRRMENVSMGITPGRALNDQGEELFDADGNPLFDPSRDVTDPNHPVQQQMQGLENLNDMALLQMEHTPVQFDRRPLQELANFVTGKNIKAEAPQRPDFDGAFAKLAGIQQRRADIVSAIKAGVANMKAGSLTEALVAQQIDKMTNEQNNAPPKTGNRNPDMNARAFTAKWLEYSKPNREALDGAQAALGAIKSGTWVGQEAFKNFMARASGEKGPLSNDDVKRFIGSQAWDAKFERFWERATTGKLTPEDQADMTTLANAYVKFRKDLLEKDSRYFKKQIGPAGYKVDEKTAGMIVTPEEGFGLKEKPAPPRKSVSDLIVEKLRAAPAAAPAEKPKPKVSDRIMEMMRKGGK